jgi:hemolysin activation/secretion protein
VGPWQAAGETRFNSVFKGGDQVSAFYFSTPQDPREYSSLGLGYNQTLLNGMTWGVSGAYGKNRNDSAPVILRGRTSIASVAMTAPLLEEPAKLISIQVRFDALNTRNAWADGSSYDDQTRVFRVGLRGFTKDNDSASSAFISASFGLDALGAAGKSALYRSRYNAPADFTKLNVQLSHYQALGSVFGLLLRADAQWSPDPLLLSEQFALGGLPFGRGYEFGELTGDRGVAGSVELRAGFDPQLPVLDYVQGYAFWDVGQTWFTGEDASYSLASGGAGARFGLFERYSLGLEAAKPLTRTPFGEADKEWRRSVTLTAQY